jgi:sulfate adenylyltransferase
MNSSRKNKTLYIDTEALSTLALVQAGLIKPVCKLMDSKTAKEVDELKIYKGVPFLLLSYWHPKANKIMKFYLISKKEKN